MRTDFISFKFYFIALFIAIFSLGFFYFPTNGDPVAGKKTFAVCATCHGQNGEGIKTLNTPAIASLPAWYVRRQLHNFKSGIRGTNAKDVYGMQMKPMAMTLTTDKAIDDVAAYIASMPVTKTEATVKGDINKGKAYYAVCATCHGPKGAGNEALGSPQLIGLQDWYLERQLHNFKSGIRGYDPKDVHGLQMKPMAMTLPNDQAIQDVLTYINSLK